MLEDPAFIHLVLPVSGACPTNTISVHRVFIRRADANHRYMTDKATRDAMVARGWPAEGDGLDLVVMGAPSQDQRSRPIDDEIRAIARSVKPRHVNALRAIGRRAETHP